MPEDIGAIRVTNIRERFKKLLIKVENQRVPQKAKTEKEEAERKVARTVVVRKVRKVANVAVNFTTPIATITEIIGMTALCRISVRRLRWQCKPVTKFRC